MTPFRLASVLVALAGRAAAQDAHAPCLEPRPDLAAYVAAFEAEGWTLAEGEARTQALLGRGELERILQHRSRTFEDIPPITDRAAWEAEARALGEDMSPGAAVLTRGEAAAVVRLADFDTELHLLCILTAPALPEADALIATEPIQDPTFAFAQVSPDPPPGADALHLAAYRHETPNDPPLAGTAAVTVTLSFPAER